MSAEAIHELEESKQPDEKLSGSPQTVRPSKKAPPISRQTKQLFFENTPLSEVLIDTITSYIDPDDYKQSCIASLRSNAADLRALGLGKGLSDKRQVTDLANYIEGLALEIEGSHRVLLPEDGKHWLPSSPNRRTIYLIPVRGQPIMEAYGYKDLWHEHSLREQAREEVLRLMDGKGEMLSSEESFEKIAALCDYEYKNRTVGRCDFDFLGRAQTTLRQWKLRHTSSSKPAITAYLLMLGLLYTAFWEGIYAGINQGDPMAFSNALKHEKIVLILFVVSVVMCVGMMTPLLTTLINLRRNDYRDWLHEDKDGNKAYSDRMNPDDIVPLRLKVFDPFSIYSQYTNMIDNCVEAIEQYQDFLKRDKLENSELSAWEKEDLRRELDLTEFFNNKIVELRQMMNDYPFDGYRINRTIRFLARVSAEKGSADYLQEFAERAAYKAEYICEERNSLLERRASFVSQWLIYPVTQAILLGLVTGVGAAIVKKDPGVFMDVINSPAEYAEILVVIGGLWLVCNFMRMCLCRPTSPPEWVDPFSNQKQYLQILDECKNKLEEYQTYLPRKEQTQAKHKQETAEVTNRLRR